MKHPGQSLNEYAVIGLLVALVCIPVLAGLGLDINQRFFSMFSAGGSGGGSGKSANRGGMGQLASGMAPGGIAVSGGGQNAASEREPEGISNTPGSSAVPGEGGNLPDATAPAYLSEPLNFKIDPVTGRVVMTIPDANGGVSQTASVEGASWVAAYAMAQLAENWRDSSGEPMPEGLKTILTELSTRAFEVGDEQYISYRDDGFIQRPIDLQTKALAFADTFRALESRIGEMSDSPYAADYRQLAETVSSYSGLISKISYENYLASYAEMNKNPLPLPVTKESYVVGSPPNISVSLQESSNMTTLSAARISQISSNPLTSVPPMEGASWYRERIAAAREEIKARYNNSPPKFFWDNP